MSSLRGATLVVALAIALLAPGLSRARQEPRITAVIEPQTATVGDHLTLTITVPHAIDETVQFHDLETAFGPFEAIEATPPEDRKAPEGGMIAVATYTLVAFETGTHVVPQIALTIWDGDVGDVYYAPNASVEIAPVAPLTATLDDLRPPHPPQDIGAPGAARWWPALTIALLVALTALIMALTRSALALRPRPAGVAPPLLPAAGVARAELDRIRAAGGGAGPPFYAALARALRAYLERRYALRATAMTAREAASALDAAGAGRWPARLTENLLRQCDAVRYAGYTPAPARAEADIAAAYEIVGLTEPPAEDLTPREERAP